MAVKFWQLNKFQFELVFILQNPGDVTSIQAIPLACTHFTEEAQNIHEVTFMEGVEVVVKVTEVGDAFSRHQFPRGQACTHDVAVAAE